MDSLSYVLGLVLFVYHRFHPFLPLPRSDAVIHFGPSKVRPFKVIPSKEDVNVEIVFFNAKAVVPLAFVQMKDVYYTDIPKKSVRGTSSPFRGEAPLAS